MCLETFLDVLEPQRRVSQEVEFGPPEERKKSNIQMFVLLLVVTRFLFVCRCCSHCRHRRGGSRFAQLSAGLGPEHCRRSDLLPRGASQGALEAPGPAGPSRPQGQILQQASAVDLQAELETRAGFVAAQEDLVLVQKILGSWGGIKGEKSKKISQ